MLILPRSLTLAWDFASKFNGYSSIICWTGRFLKNIYGNIGRRYSLIFVGKNSISKELSNHM